MAEADRKQFNDPEKINWDRERSSSFVVDLREKMAEQAARLEQAARPAESKIILKAKIEWRELERNVKKIQPNLITKEIKNALKPKIKSQPTSHNYFQKLLIWPTFQWPSFRPRRKNWLVKTIREKQRFLSAPLKVRSHSSRNSQRREDVLSTVSWYRSLFSFALILLLIIIPLKLLSSWEFFDLKGLEAKIISRSQLAMNNLLAAADSISQQDFKGADQKFQQAGRNFLAAQEDLNQINDGLLALAALSSNPKLKLAAESKKFLTAGALAATLGRNLVLATDSLFNGDKGNLTVTLDNFSRYGEPAVENARDLKKELAKINPDNLPEAYRAKFMALNQQAALLSDNLADFIGAAEKLKTVLGATRDKRYLLVFQNNAELRASGGFLGSYALLDLRAGQIRNLEVPGGGSYDTEAGLKHLVVAPGPLWLVDPLWHFWDANWWPDWPTTAKNLMWFYAKSDGPSVDGVISVTPTVVERLLEITGPIDLTKEYGLTIDADNFWDTVQKIVEQKNLAKTNPEAILSLPASSTAVTVDLPLKQGLEINSSNKPKKIIGDLMAKILEILPTKLTKDNLVKILTLFEANLSEKQILFYFNDPDLQAEVSQHNWAGEIRETNRDYLLVVNTNIAGQKSDRKMIETIDETSEVSAEGAVVNTLKITRTHTGLKNEPLVGVRNVDWLRVYVPLGSELISADGFKIPDAKYLNEQPAPTWEQDPLLANEVNALIDDQTGTKIYPENNKTVFANWVMVDPGESAVITLKYRLPFNFFAKVQSDSWLKRLNEFLNPDSSDLYPHSLLVQKQPGAPASRFTHRLILPSGWDVFWRYPDNLIGWNGWEIDTALDSDKYWSILLEKK